MKLTDYYLLSALLKYLFEFVYFSSALCEDVVPIIIELFLQAMYGRNDMPAFLQFSLPLCDDT